MSPERSLEPAIVGTRRKFRANDDPASGPTQVLITGRNSKAALALLDSAGSRSPLRSGGPVESSAGFRESSGLQAVFGAREHQG